MPQAKEHWLQACRGAVEVLHWHIASLPPSDLQYAIYLKIMAELHDTMQRIALMNPSGQDVSLCHEDIRDISRFFALVAWSTGSYTVNRDLSD